VKEYNCPQWELRLDFGRENRELAPWVIVIENNVLVIDSAFAGQIRPPEDFLPENLNHVGTPFVMQQRDQPNLIEVVLILLSILRKNIFVESWLNSCFGWSSTPQDLVGSFLVPFFV
jgi:hypothetical protein